MIEFGNDDENLIMIDEDSASAHNYIIGDFEGPIELIYSLIQQKKMDILDINLAEITDKFVLIVSQMDATMQEKAEFVEIAAMLTYIKSKKLLPIENLNINDDSYDDSEEDPEEELTRRVSEYALLICNKDKLQLHEKINKYYKEPDFTDLDARYVAKDFTLDSLVDAFAKMLYSLDNEEITKAVRKIEKDTFTVKEKKLELFYKLVRERQISFYSLLSKKGGRNEIIATFLAMLDLLKKQVITVDQDDWRGDISLSCRQEIDENFEIDELKKGEEDYDRTK